MSSPPYMCTSVPVHSGTILPKNAEIHSMDLKRLGKMLNCFNLTFLAFQPKLDAPEQFSVSSGQTRPTK